MPSHSELLAQGTQHLQANRLAEAEQLFRQVYQADSRNAEALHLLGALSFQQGMLVAAGEYFQKAVEIEPGQARYQNSLGAVLGSQRKNAEALACFRKAEELDGNYAEAVLNRAGVLLEMDQLAEARSAYQKVLALRPHHPDALLGLGKVEAHANQPGAAIPYFEESLKVRFAWPEAWNCLGNVHHQLGRLDQATGCYRKALELNPNFPEAMNNLGLVCRDLGLYSEAGQWFVQALQKRADYPMARWNLALLFLLHGDYEKGFANYEWRWRTRLPQFQMPNYGKPPWDGRTDRTQTVFLSTEQGRGDMLQFIRYVPLVKERAGRVVVGCPKNMVGILSTCEGIDELIPSQGVLPPFDFHLPLMSLPLVLGTRIDTIPARVPYLKAEPERVERWKQRLTGIPGFRVGVFWQGRPGFWMDRHRSIPLSAFGPLAQLPDVSLVSLQKGPGVEQLAPFREAGKVHDLGPIDDDGAFLDSAAILKNLDLLVTSDSSLAHLGGALGVKVWLALSATPEWRWLLHRQDSPWYPSVRLFRQEKQGEWGPVFDRMARELTGERRASAS